MKKNNKSNLFSQNNLDNVNYILEDKITILENNTKYAKMYNEMNTLYDNLAKKLPKTDLENMEKIFYLHGEMESYTNTLSYFLGIQFGKDIMSL